MGTEDFFDETNRGDRDDDQNRREEEEYAAC